MISRLDHVNIAVRDPDAVGDAFRRLLGRAPDVQDGLGSRRVWFRFPNLALEILGPTGEGPSGDGLRRRLETHGEGLWLLCFRVDDLHETVRRLGRRGLPMQVTEYTRPVALGEANGVSLGLVTPSERPLSPAVAPDEAIVGALDRVSIHSSNLDRALGVYGARLGLELCGEDLQRNVRRMCFRCGDAAIEVSTYPEAWAPESPDRLSGLAWRVADVEAAKTRLEAAGFDVSDVQPGGRPGTRQITVNDAPVGIPTLMVQPTLP